MTWPRVSVFHLAHQIMVENALFESRGRWASGKGPGEEVER